MKDKIKSLIDTPFSLERLFVWATGVVMLVGMIGMITLAFLDKTIPPQIQSVVMISLGAFIARIERRRK